MKLGKLSISRKKVSVGIPNEQDAAIPLAEPAGSSKKSSLFKRASGQAGIDSNQRGVQLLTGVDAFITLGELHGEDQLQGLVKVASRKASLPIRKSYFERGSRELVIYINNEVKKNHRKVRLAADAYLRLGLFRSMKTKGRPLVILGGDYSSSGINVEVMVFTRGEIVEVMENSLPSQDSLDFDDMLETLIQSLRDRYEGCVIEQCANLPRWNRVEISEYHDERIFKASRSVNLHPNDSPLRTFSAAGAMVLTGGLFYGWTIYSGFSEHSELVDQARDLEIQMSMLTDEQVTIEIMEARESFKVRPAGGEPEYVAHVRDIAQAVSTIPGAEISTVQSPGSEPGIAAYLSMTVVRDGMSSALEQAREVLDELVAKTSNYTMRLSRTQGINERGNRIQFHIEVIHE